MSLKILHDSSPELPFSFPLADGLATADKIKISVDLKPKSCLEVTFKASDEEKIDSRIPLHLSLSIEDGIICKSGKNNKWERTEPAKPIPIQNGVCLLTIVVDEEEYKIEVDGDLFCTFSHTYPPFISELLEINVSKGRTQVKSVSYSREIKWLGARIDIPIPETAFKCGKDESDNDIYLGRGLKNNSLIIVAVNPNKNQASVSFNGREWPIQDYELLQDNSYYGWKLVDNENPIPENAIEGGFDENGETILIGRVKTQGFVIPGTLYKKNGILSVPFKGKELKLSSHYEVLALRDASEIKNNKNKNKEKTFEETAETKPKVTPVKNEQECVICLENEVTTAFVPCGHLNFCDKCAKEHMKTNKSCPICRKPILTSLKTFRS